MAFSHQTGQQSAAEQQQELERSSVKGSRCGGIDAQGNNAFVEARVNLCRMIAFTK